MDSGLVRRDLCSLSKELDEMHFYILRLAVAERKYSCLPANGLIDIDSANIGTVELNNKLGGQFVVSTQNYGGLT